MLVRSAVIVIFLAALANPESRAYAQPLATIPPEELTDEHMQLAIEAIASELVERKDAERFWEPEQPPRGESAQPGGYTALAVLALLSAGESYQGSRLRDAVKHLEELEIDATYGLAMRASLWAGLPMRFKKHLEQDAQRLLRGFQREPRGWYYQTNGPSIYISNSRRMFGALGLWEAANRGVNIPPAVWRQLEQVFLELQLADGGWNYRGDGPATGSMTASGLATLFITQDHLHADRFVPLTGRRRAHPSDHAIERGLAWMDRHFAADDNPGMTVRNQRSRYFYYYLYSVERAALASGYKHFGGRDWFREGAAELIRRFCDWDPLSRTMTMHETTYGDGGRAALRTDDLAFGLLFLSRGRVPVAINKLRDESVSWNNRPRDVANATAWLRDEIATEINWQIADISAEPESWLDAPLLYFASNAAVSWAKRGSPELEKMKRYLDLGGLLVAVNEGRGRAFAESIENAGRILYPHYEWRTLEANHWAYSAHVPIAGARPRLRGLSNGVRELIITCADDLSATFQAGKTDAIVQYHTLANLYVYASEMNRPKPRLAAQNPVNSLADIDLAVGAEAFLVRASHNGNWKPEPLALDVFAKELRDSGDLSLTIADHPLETIHELVPKPHLVMIADTSPREFTQEEQSAMNEYLGSGGTILFEQPGGHFGAGGFVQSAEATMRELTGGLIGPMRAHSVVTGEGIAHASDFSSVEYRPYSMQVTGDIEKAPRLRGMSIGDHGLALFSYDDISHALLDQPRWGVSGYSPRSARMLLRNILLFTLDAHSNR